MSGGHSLHAPRCLVHRREATAEALSLTSEQSGQAPTFAHPFATIRGRVVDRLEGRAAWAIVDRLSQEYLGQPDPRGEERVVFVVEPEHFGVWRTAS